MGDPQSRALPCCPGLVLVADSLETKWRQNGVVESLGSSLFPLWNNHFGANYRDAYGLIIFLVVLLVRPEGLFGKTVKRV